MDVTGHTSVDGWWPGVGRERSEKATEVEADRLEHVDLDGENRSCREYRSAKNKADITTTSKRDFEPVENSYNTQPPCLPPNLNVQPQRCSCFSDA